MSESVTGFRMLPIRLDAYRHVDGWRFVNPDRPDMLISLSDRVEPLVLETAGFENPLFLRLINCRSEADFQRFVERFFHGDHVAVGWLEGKRDAIRQAANTALVPITHDNLALRALVSGVSLRPELRRVDSTDRLVLVASNLFDFMAVEVAGAVEAGANMAACAHCERSFLFGPLTGRRSHGQYCEDKCRVAAMRARKTSAGEKL